MIYILSWTTKKHQIILSRPLRSKLKKIQGLFKDLDRNLRAFRGKLEFKDFSRTSPKIQGLFKGLDRNLRAFQGKMEFKDFSRTSPKIQGLFKTVRTL